jgi:hypothetical protein
MPIGLNPSFACQGFLPFCSQGCASSARYHVRRVWLSAAGVCWEWCRRSALGCCNCADGYRSLNNGDVVEYTVGSGVGGPNCAHPRHRGWRGGGGGRPTPSRRPLWRRHRWFLGGGPGQAPSRTWRQSPFPRCCLAPNKPSMKPRQLSVGNGRRWNPRTSASVTSAPSWRSAPWRRPASLPLSGLNSRGTAKITKGTSRRCSPRSWRRREKRLAKREEALD